MLIQNTCLMFGEYLAKIGSVVWRIELGYGYTAILTLFEYKVRYDGYFQRKFKIVIFNDHYI